MGVQYFYAMSLVANETTLSVLVKEATATVHAELEDLLLPKLSSIETFEDYAALLKMFYGFYNPLENSILQYISADILPDIFERRKTILLQHDLAALGQNTNKILHCFSLPSITNPAAAFGAMYVLEGSTLGGRVITKMLLQNNGVPPTALLFFSGYGESTGSKWKSFLQTLNAQVREKDVIAGANATFLHLKSWMQKTL